MYYIRQNGPPQRNRSCIVHRSQEEDTHWPVKELMFIINGMLGTMPTGVQILVRFFVLLKQRGRPGVA